MWVRFLLPLLAVTRYNKFNKFNKFNNKPIINFLKHRKIEKSNSSAYKHLPHFLRKLNKKTFKFFFFKYKSKTNIISPKSYYNLTLKHFDNVLLTLINDKFFFYSKTLLTFNNIKTLFYTNNLKKLTSSFSSNLYWLTSLNLTSFSALSFFSSMNRDLLSLYFFYLNNFNYTLKTFNFYKSNFTKKKYSQIFNFNKSSSIKKKLPLNPNNYSVFFKTPLHLKFNSFNKFSSFWETYLLCKNFNYTSFFKKSAKNQFLKYFLYSSFFFKTFSKTKKFFNIFKLKPFDIVNEHFILLTRESTELSLNNFFFFKNNNFTKYPLTTLLSFSTLFYQNDSLFENTFFKTKLNTNGRKSSTRIQKLNLNNLMSILFKNYFFNKPSIKLKKKLKKKLKHLFYKENNFTRSFIQYETTFKKPVLSFKSPYFFSSFEFFSIILTNPLFLKYSFFLKKNNASFNYFSNQSFNYFNFNLKKNYFYTENNTFFLNNILPTINFTYIFKKWVVKLFNYSKFPSITIFWHYHTLVRFVEFCSGLKVFIKLFNFLTNKLTFNEKAQCLLWAQKVKYFRKVLGPRLFLNESLQIMYLALKLKDPFVLSNWIVSTMQKISFWKYKTFLRYIKYVLRYFFWVIFRELKIKGIKFQLKGKISVAGNARTRTVLHTVGFTSHSTFNNKILYKLNLVRTFTGVLGLKLWIVF